MDLKSIGKKIKEQRIRKNISQEKLAELIDVTPSYISKLESGNRIASLHTMLEIVNKLELSFDYLQCFLCILLVAGDRTVAYF